MDSRENEHPGRGQLRIVRMLMPKVQITGVIGPILDPRIGPPTWRFTDGLQIFATVQPAADDSPWYHVSYSRADSVPDHVDTLLVRRVFFMPGACVLAVFPPVDEYVNDHPYCLHLWQRIGVRIVPDLRVPGPMGATI